MAVFLLLSKCGLWGKRASGTGQLSDLKRALGTGQLSGFIIVILNMTYRCHNT